MSKINLLPLEAEKVGSPRTFPDHAANHVLWKLNKQATIVDTYYNKEVDFSFAITSVSLVSDLETAIFPADESGEIICWQRLEGTVYGESNHNQAIANFLEWYNRT